MRLLAVCCLCCDPENRRSLL